MMSKNWNDSIEVFASKSIEFQLCLAFFFLFFINKFLEHIQIYKTLALRWQINVS